MDWSFLDGIEARCKARSDFAASGQDYILSLTKEQLLPAVQVVRDADWYIEDVTVMDMAEGYEALYHFSHFEWQGKRLTLRVLTSHDDARFPSIGAIYPGAVWHERESKDMYFVQFDNIENDRPLLLADDMEDAAPLRKDDKSRASSLDMAPFFEVTECTEEGHPWPALAARREEEKQAAEEEARRKTEEEAKKQAEEETAAAE